MTTTPSTPVEFVHIHRWCYQGDLLVGEVEPHRQEFCVECGTTRVWFQMGWAYQYPDLARKFLASCTEVKDTHVSQIPESIYRAPGKQRKRPDRLGRGLLDLQKTLGAAVIIKGLFPQPKK